MSIDATNWAWRQQLPPSQKILLLSLADRADETGRAWPSVSRLSLDTSLDQRTIYRNIKILADEGLIVIHSSPGKKSYYQLVGITHRENVAQKNSPSEVFLQNEHAKPLTQCRPCQNVTPDTMTGEPLTQCHPTPDIYDIASKDRTQREPKEKRKEKSARAKESKQAFGSFGNVLLTQKEHDALIAEHGVRGEKAITKLDAYIGSTGKRYKSHYMVMFSWVLTAVLEDEAKEMKARASPQQSSWQSPAQRRLEANQQAGREAKRLLFGEQATQEVKHEA